MEVNLDNIGAILVFLATSAAYSAHAIKKLFFSKEKVHQKKVFNKSDELDSVKVRAITSYDNLRKYYRFQQLAGMQRQVPKQFKISVSNVSFHSCLFRIKILEKS